MPTVTSPTKYRGDTLSALKEFLGDDADGLTDAQVYQKSWVRLVKPMVRAYRRRRSVPVSAAIVAADNALSQRETAAATAVKARKDAEDTEDASVEAAFNV